MAGMRPTPAEVYGCLLARFEGTVPPPWLREWLDQGLAGVLLFAGNITGRDQLADLTRQLREHNPRVLIAADEEGGIVTRVEAATGSSYPGNGALGAIDDVELTRQVGRSIGAMLAGSGVSLDLAPVADTDTSGGSPVIGVRSFGATPDRVAAHTAAFVAGVQANGVGACAKHFPGHGRTTADSHLELPSVPATLDDLRACDLVPFRAAIEADVRSVMTAHVLFPAIDDVPATLSRRLLAGVLRDELGFGGVVITDALGMAAIGDGQDRADGAVAALAAGADLLCLPAGDRAQLRARDALAAAGRDGTLPRSRLDDAAARVSALAAWASPDPAARPDPALGLAAARRAMLACGAMPGLPAPPYLLDAGGRMSAQLEDATASLLGVLRGILPGTSGVRLTGPADLDGLTARIEAVAGRPLIVVVRDAHVHHWQRELLRKSLALRPDALVVGTGTTGDRELAGSAYLGTRGASRASLVAAAMMIAGQDGDAGPAARKAGQP